MMTPENVKMTTKTGPAITWYSIPRPEYSHMQRSGEESVVAFTKAASQLKKANIF